MSEEFEFFWKGPFSQWHRQSFTFEGMTFNCAEQFMMFMKAVYFEDYETAAKIMKTSNPREQKEWGREVKNFTVDKWVPVATKIVYVGNYRKFGEEVLYDLLMDTGTKTLVEASPFDKIWGIGLEEDNPKAKQRATWQGKNLLGETITKVREDFINNEWDQEAFALCTVLVQRWKSHG